MGKYLDLLKDEATTLLRNKKNLVNLLILGILILGLWLGVDLARREQILKSRATNPPIAFTGDNVKQSGNQWVVLDASKPITLELTAPPLDSSSTQGSSACKTQEEVAAAALQQFPVVRTQILKDTGWPESTSALQIVNKWIEIAPQSDTNAQRVKKDLQDAASCRTSWLVKTAYAGHCEGDENADKRDNGTCSTGTWCKSSTNELWSNDANGDHRGLDTCVNGCENGACKSSAPPPPPSSCGTPSDPYPQCGARAGDCRGNGSGGIDDKNTVIVTPHYDDSCNLYYTCDDRGPQPGQCRNPGGTGKGACRDNPETPPAGTKWQASCSLSCTPSSNNSGCPQNDFDPANINPSTSNWCYGFDSDKGGAKCLMLVRPGCEKRGDPGCGVQAASKVYVDPNTINSGASANVIATAGRDCSTNIQLTQGAGLTNCSPSGGSTCSGGNPKDTNTCWWKWTCTAGTTSGTFNASFNASGSNCSSRPTAYTITRGGSTTATPTHFRVAENPAYFSETGAHGWQDYTADGMRVDFPFTDKTPGQKTVFVEFKYTNDRTQRRNAQIRILGPNPAITGCSLNFEGNNTILNIKGSNFGSSRGLAKSNDTTLTIRQWNNDSIQAIFQNAPVGEELPIAVTNSDNQTGSGRCSAISQLSLGAKVFCRAPSSHDTDNVDMVLAEAFAGGKKTKQKVKIDKEGVILGLNQKLEAGKKYKIALKAPKSLRKTVEFTAGDGTTNIPNFVLPVGDIFPADGGDGTINSLDKLELNRQFILTQAATGRSGDFNKDGRVNSIDWACMRNGFGSTDDAEPDPGGPVVTVSPSPSPSASIIPSSNLLRSDMQNAHYTVNSGANFQVWFDAGAYRLSGTVNATAVAQRTPLATITADEWDLTTTPPTFIRTYDNNTDFTVPAGHKMGVVLRVVDADATFSNVSLIKK